MHEKEQSKLYDVFEVSQIKETIRANNKMDQIFTCNMN